MAFKQFVKNLQTPAYREATFIICLTAVLFILGPTLHWSKYYTGVLHKYSQYALDESAMTLSVISFFLFVYVIRRNNEKQKIIGQQKMIETALEKTRDNLNVLLKSSSSIIYNTEASGDFKLLYMTENITSILGYEKEEYFQPGWWFNNIHLEDQQVGSTELANLFATGSLSFEYRFKHKNDSWLWMHSHAQLVYKEDGTPTEVVGTFWDITNEVMEKEKIRASNERVQLAFKATKDIIYDWDLVTNDLWMSEEIYNSYGYKKDNTVVTIPWWEALIHPEDHDFIFADVMNAIVKKRTSWTGEYRFRCDDGSYKNVIDRRFIMYSNDGAAVRWIGSMSDITTQKATEQLLLASNERFELASSASSDTIYDSNLSTGELWMSDEIFRSFGYPYDTNINSQWWEEKIHRDDLPGIKQSVVEAKKAKKDLWSQNYRLRKADGTYAYICDRRHIIYNTEGQPIRGIGSMTNITNLKQVEMELRAAKEKAEESVRFKGEFLANMSHEIRTPLNGIIGMTELALETDINVQQKRYLENIQFSSETLLTLVNDILEFSKIDAGKLELSPVNFSFRDEIPRSLQGLSLKASEKKLEFIFTLDQNVPDLYYGDVFRLQQAILNLTGNAIKFTERGEVAVKCNLKSVNQAEATLQVSVSDTGIGIANNKLASIFEEFTQADGCTSRKYGGTGLGLAITRSLIEMMDGTIWVESEEGKGSTFYFTIPMKLQHVQNKPRFVGGTALEGKRVLIVEDNEATQPAHSI